jgi:predicted metal-dependent hydrolase
MQNSADFQYKMVFSRRHTISITISPDQGVVVKAPNRTPVRLIDRFVNEKSDWIRKTLLKFNSLVRIDGQKGYLDCDSISLFGREHKLKLISSDKQYVRLVDDSIIEAGYVTDNNALKIKVMLEAWFKSVAQKRFTIIFNEILAKYSNYEFLPSGFVVRKMKSRWGSCSSKGKIAISYDLIRLDDIYGEYVIIHELCHLKHHNHSADYYRLLSEVYPDWKRVRKELTKYVR